MMDKNKLDALLSAPALGLERSGDRVRAGDDRPLTMLVVAGQDVVRLERIEAVHLDPALVEADQAGLEREGAYMVIDVTGVFAVERERKDKESDRRRTGFV